MEEPSIIGHTTKSNATFRYIPVVNLKRGGYQPRQDFPQDGLESLAKTIMNDGILEPLLVRPLNERDFEIIAGERRWRAAQIAQLHEVPCLIRNYDDEQAARIALIENTCRENLNPIAEAQAIQRIIDEFNYTHEEVGAVLGKPRPVITNQLRLLKLDHQVQELLKSANLTEAHGKLLAGIPVMMQYPIALEAAKKQWTTRVLETAIKNQLMKTKMPNNMKKDVNIAHLERNLSDQIGHHVIVEFKKDKSGSLNICFRDLEQLNNILDKLGYRHE